MTGTELLKHDVFAVDDECPHIVVDAERCALCPDQPCLWVCPAGLYHRGDGGAVGFDHAGCLECGTCRVICPAGGLASWTYPRGGFGVAYRHG